MNKDTLVEIHKEVSITTKQYRVICEALYHMKKDLEGATPANIIAKLSIKHKIDELDGLISALEPATKYDFYKNLEKCNKKRKKDSDFDDIGEDAMLILSKRKTKSEEQYKKELNALKK